MRRALMILLFAAGCGGTIETTTQPLKVAPIDGLPAYDGGRVLHPWHSSKPARERFAQVPIAASASDADCLLGDERFELIGCPGAERQASPHTRTQPSLRSRLRSRIGRRTSAK